MTIEILGECTISEERLNESPGIIARALREYDRETLRLECNLLLQALEEREAWIRRLSKWALTGEDPGWEDESLMDPTGTESDPVGS